MIWRIVQIILWPALFIYFRTIGKNRARVLILYGDEVLLIQDARPLIYHKGCWSLPGGGINRDEKPAEAAMRELKEELGLHLNSRDLKYLGTQPTTEHKITYSASFYAVNLSSKPELQIEHSTISKAEWLKRASIIGQPIHPSVAQAEALLVGQ